MTLPPDLFNKYLSRFEELINEGEEIEKTSSKTGGLDCYTNNYQPFVAWQVKCLTLLSQIVPQKNPSRKLIVEEIRLGAEEYVDIHVEIKNTAKLKRVLAYLKAIQSDFKSGFLQNLELEIESEIAADYMGQAEQTIS